MVLMSLAHPQTIALIFFIFFLIGHDFHYLFHFFFYLFASIQDRDIIEELLYLLQ